MITQKTPVLGQLLKIHDDEDGMEAIQVVAIVAIGAIVLIMVKTVLYPMIRDWAKGKAEDLTND